MKILFLTGLIPVFIVVLVAKIFGRNISEVGKSLACTGESLALSIFKNRELKVSLQKRVLWSSNPVKKQELVLEEKLAKSQTIGDLAAVLYQCGFALLWLSDKKIASNYFKAKRAAAILPVLTIVGAVLLKVANRVSFNVTVLIAISGIALASLFCLLNLIAGLRAAQAVAIELERGNLIKSYNNRELLNSQVRVLAFRDVLPSMLKFLM